MNFFGNDQDPFAKTLKDINENAKTTSSDNAGDFFSAVCERDPFTKPKNSNKEELEFNAAVLMVDNATDMLKYINLKNRVLAGDCFSIEESEIVDKNTGAVTIFVKWLQPTGQFKIGTATELTLAPLPGSEEPEPTNIPAPTTTTKKFKGKGSRKKNQKLGSNYGDL